MILKVNISDILYTFSSYEFPAHSRNESVKFKIEAQLPPSTRERYSCSLSMPRLSSLGGGNCRRLYHTHGKNLSAATSTGNFGSVFTG